MAKQVLSTGTGALNIDGSRIGTGGAHGGGAKMSSSGKTLNSYGEYESDGFKTSQQGRWPANVLISHHERCQRVGVKRIRPSNGSARAGTPKPGKKSTINAYGEYGPRPETVGFTHTDPDGYEEVEAWECVDGCPVEHLGEPARFFYVAKASRAERGEGNTHPCVKPLALMSYLIKLATPPGGVVLDPFMGSGTTGVACVEEGFDFIGIEQNLEYLTIAQRRIEWATLQAGQHVLPRSPSIPRVNGKVDTELQGSLWRDSVSSGKE